nr:MFS transporter [uncultured Cellulosilyticum sp.]
MSCDETVKLPEKVGTYNLGVNFWLLLFGKIVSQLGDGIFNLALPWYILSVTNSATAMSSYLVLANVVCGISIMIFGRYIDRWKKEKVLYIADIIRGIYILFLFAVIVFKLEGQLIWMYICAVVLNICAALFNPASMSIIPELVEERGLVKANALLSMVDNLIALIGLAVGGIIYQIFGIKLIFLIAGMAYVLSGVSEMFIHPNRSITNSRKQENTSLKDGIKYLMTNNRILFIIVFALVWNYIYISVYSIYIPYVFNTIYKTTIGAVAIIQIGMFVGMIIGASIASRYNMKENMYKHLTHVVIIQLPVFVMLPIILIINSVYINYELFVIISFSVLFFILGISVAIVNVNIGVILQKEVKGEFLGRVYSFKALGSMISMALGLAIGGIIIERIDVSVAFAIQAFLFVILCFTMIKKFLIKDKIADEN